MRGDLEFIKIADGTAERLAGVPFKITSLTTGESHTVVTDVNGYASTASSWNKHTNNTNRGQTSSDGIWFGSSAPDDSKGALPYDDYLIEEQSCEANKGMKLLKLEVSIYKNAATVPLGTLTDKKNELETTVWDSDINEERVTLARDNITLTDRVRYENLEEGARYTLKGLLMDKETEEPILIDGKEVTGETTFTAKANKGTIDVKFTFDASSLRGKEIVVFETLLQDGIVVASHEDIDDMDQTIEFLNPKVGTTAIDPETGNQYSCVGEKSSMPTRYNVVKAAIDEAISKSCNMYEFDYHLKSIFLIVDHVSNGKAFDCFKQPSVCSSEFRLEDWNRWKE